MSIRTARSGAAGDGRRDGAPTVFALGASSPMPVSQGQRTAALMPAAEVNVIPDAGHLPWHEQPGCVAAALARVRERAAEGAP